MPLGMSMRLSPEKNVNKEEGFILNMGSIIHGASPWLNKKKMSRAPAFTFLWFLTADVIWQFLYPLCMPLPALNCKSKQTPSSLRCFLLGRGSEKGNSLAGYAPWDPSLNMLWPLSESLEGPMVHRSKIVHIHWCSEKLSTDSISEKPVLPSTVFLFLSSGFCHPGAHAASSLMLLPTWRILLTWGNRLLYFLHTFIILYTNLLQGFISIFG